MNVLDEGHALLVSVFYPPNKYASSVVMKNLFNKFYPNSYSVVSRNFFGNNKAPANRYTIYWDIKYSFRINQYWQYIQMPLASYRLKKIVQHLKPKVIVSVFPDFYHLKTSFDVSAKMGIPNVIYFHDTLAESLYDTYISKHAIELQNEIFKAPLPVFVLTQGMAELFQNKYKKDCVLLQHIFDGEIVKEYRDINNGQAFFAGAVYQTNTNAVGRLAKALRKEGYSLNLSTITNKKTLLDRGIISDFNQVKYFSDYSLYLETLSNQELLIVGLDWPNESPMHQDELATIFPTKMTEYLAAGRPIVAHCPENYYLARFINHYKCGLVISEPDPECIVAGLCELKDPKVRANMGQNALNVVKQFSSDRISSIFS
jgi:glycosyltransferase involved in cell wall biosynthesis